MHASFSSFRVPPWVVTQRPAPRPISRPRSLARTLGPTLPLMAALATAGCQGGDSAPNRHGFVDSRDEYDPRSLDPALATDVPTGRAVAYVFDGLTRFTPDARVAPGLATRWEVSPDGRVYTFHLRPGVRFHDGTPLLAQHVVASWVRALAPTNKGGDHLPLFPIHGARAVAAGQGMALAGARALDDSTLQVTLDTALAIFPKLLAMPVASVVAPNPGPDFGQHPVGTGPWRFVEWKHDDYLRFARNPGYWGGAPGADTLTARIIPEQSTAVAEFENGTVDVLAVPESETRAWEQTDERQARLQSAPALRLYYVAINTTRGPLADARVRQALNIAVDKKAILDRLVAGRGIRASGVIPGALDSLADDRAPYPYDPARARQLLTAAGFPNGIDVQLWSSQQPTVARMAQAIQGYLKAVGVRATLVQRDAPSVREAARNGQVDLVIKDWFADYPDADAFLTPLLASTSKGPGGNLSFYANKRVDSLITAARRTNDDQQRAALSRQADSAAFADAPIIYLFHYNVLYAIQPWIRNFQVPTIYNGQRWLGVTVDHSNGAAIAPQPAPASAGASSQR